MKSIYHTCIVRFHGDFVVSGPRKNSERKAAIKRTAKRIARKMDWKIALEDVDI